MKTYSVQDRDQARKLADRHYENFPVATPWLTGEQRKHIRNVYAYARTVDDLGDEAPGDRHALLDWWEKDLERVFESSPEHSVLKNLQESVEECDLPREPFRRLLKANRIDQVKDRYRTFGELLDYCRYSANPCGRLYLMVCGCRDEDLFALADRTCSALQLTNFWQDIGRDLEEGRVYVPEAVLRKHDLSRDHLLEMNESGEVPDRFFEMMDVLLQETRSLFADGLDLVDRVESGLQFDILLFTLGGATLLDKLQKRKYPVFSYRVKLHGLERIKLFARAGWTLLFGRVGLYQRELRRKGTYW